MAGIRVDFPTAAPLAVLDQNATSGLIDPAGCVLVAEVEPGSPAERAGVQPNRFISAVNGVRVQNPRQFFAAVGEVSGEATLTFTTPKPVELQLALQFQPGIVFPHRFCPLRKQINRKQLSCRRNSTTGVSIAAPARFSLYAT